MVNPQTQRFSAATRLVHWLAAALFLVAFALGLAVRAVAPAPAAFGIYRVHAVLGLVILLLLMARVYLALRHPRPAAMPHWPGWMRALSGTVHVLLYLLPFVLVASGLGMTLLTPLGQIAFFGGAGAWPDVAAIPPGDAHLVAAIAFAAAFVLHLAGALYHQFWLRDGIFARIGLMAAPEVAVPAADAAARRAAPPMAG